jgi:hypothetical protein
MAVLESVSTLVRNALRCLPTMHATQMALCQPQKDLA